MSTAQGWELRLIEDVLPANQPVVLAGEGIHRALYLAHGQLSVDGTELAADNMLHSFGDVELRPGSEGASVWRWELARSHKEPELLPNWGSRFKISSVLDGLASSDLLLRGDSVAFPAEGCALLHRHQGPGIRCLLEGGIRIDTHGSSTSYGPGGAWFEAGPEPVFAQATHKPTRFVRVMVLPTALLGKSSISYVNEEDLAKPKSQSYRGYLDVPITL